MEKLEKQLEFEFMTGAKEKENRDILGWGLGIFTAGFIGILSMAGSAYLKLARPDILQYIDNLWPKNFPPYGIM
jgi:hypothetical protein